MSMMMLTNPLLWLGALTFSNNRLDTYETLIESLSDSGRSSPVTLQAIFLKWAERDKFRGESRHLVFTHLARSLEGGGKSFAQALRPFVPNDEFLILSSGEIRGDMVTSLKLVVRNLLATREMNAAVGAAMAQPLLGVGSILGMSYAFGHYMWPTFVRAIPLKFWPGWTVPCLDAQIWFASNWWVLMFAFAVAALYQVSLSRWTGRTRDWFDRVPPWSIYKGRQASSLLGVLSALVSSGRTVRESLVLVRNLSTPYMAWRLNQIIRRYDASGKDAMSALRTGFFSQPVMDRIEDAVEQRSFDETLKHVGNNALKVITRAVQAQANTANGIFLTVVTVVFLYITAVSVFGVQDAIDAYIKTIGGGVSMTSK